MIKSVVVIGSGNVAEALVHALSLSCIELRQVFARNASRGTELARRGSTIWSDNPSQLAKADLYLIAVSDRAVAQVAAALSFAPQSIVAHTAGCVSLNTLPEQITHRAVLYPFQSFTQGCEVDFGQIPIFIESTTAQLQTQMENFAHHLSREVHPANGTQRAQIHLSGVFANNFTNHLIVCAKQLFGQAQLPYELLHPIIGETLRKALDTSDPASMQTGPAVRGDAATQQRHLDMIADETLRTIYQSISKHIWETSKKI